MFWAGFTFNIWLSYCVKTIFLKNVSLIRNKSVKHYTK